MKKIAVLLSSYNGDEYIETQLSSVLRQEGVDVTVYIRDDGSKDKTRDILRKFVEVDDRVKAIFGENVGFRDSFLELLNYADGFEYYAFCDQDDYWEVGKLSRAIEILEKEQVHNIPAIYYSNLEICDRNLNHVKMTKLEKRVASLESMALRRSVAGCTMVFNRRMREIALRCRPGSAALCRGHDSFLLTLCDAVGGKLLFDKEAYIKYRRHGSNTSGGTGLLQRVSKELTNLFIRRGTEQMIAQEILVSWSDLIAQDKKNSLQMIAQSKYNFKARLSILTSAEFRTGVPVLTALGKIKTMIGNL